MEILNLHLYQIAVVAFSGVMLALGFQKYLSRQLNQSLLKLLVRIIVWGGMIVVVLFPNITNVLAEFVGLEGNINAVILTGFLLVFLFIFKILSVVERIERDITTLTRKDALSKISNDDQ